MRDRRAGRGLIRFRGGSTRGRRGFATRLRSRSRRLAAGRNRSASRFVSRF